MDAKRKAVLIALLLKRGVREKIIKKKVAYIALANKLRKRRKSPDFWVHPILEERFRSYVILHEMMFKYPKKFKKHFRMSPEAFNLLLGKVQSSIKKKNTKRRQSIQAKYRLAVTLR